MDVSELNEEQRETLRRLGSDSAEETIIMEHVNPLITFGVCRRRDNINIELTDLGRNLYNQIVERDSNQSVHHPPPN